MMMHTMRALEDEGGWSVGFYLDLDTQMKWIEICQFSKETDALNRVNQLNGGPGVAIPAILNELIKVLSRPNHKLFNLDPPPG